MCRRIRPFINTDIPAVAQIWREHHECFGSDGSFPAAAWEQTVFGKLSFDPSTFLVYEGEFGPLGFIHATTANSLGIAGPSGNLGLINALCVRQHPHETEIASGLIQETLNCLDRLQCDTTLAMGSPRLHGFYLGVGDASGLLGVPVEDLRLQKWLGLGGFQESDRIDAYELDFQRFRVPMDRNQIAIRRQARLENPLEGTGLFSHAQTMLFGHAEVQHFVLHLRDRPDSKLIVHFWRPEIQAAGNNPVRSRFHVMLDEIDQAESVEPYIFLFSESVRQLQQLRGSSARCSVLRSGSPLVKDLLRRLGFLPKKEGILYSRESRSV